MVAIIGLDLKSNVMGTGQSARLPWAVEPPLPLPHGFHVISSGEILRANWIGPFIRKCCLQRCLHMPSVGCIGTPAAVRNLDNPPDATSLLMDGWIYCTPRLNMFIGLCRKRQRWYYSASLQPCAGL